jgi:N-acetylneuraminate synthase/N,N'-diacetyllegionaminate synthase
VNHNGDLGVAHQLIDAAAKCGADAVKFQAFDPSAVANATACSTPYQQRATGTTKQRDLLVQLALPKASWPELSAHAGEVGLVFLCTPFDLESADLLQDLDIAAYKVSSGELDNLSFISNLANRGRPLLVSTGMGTQAEVEAALAAAESSYGVALLHCVTAYPAPSAASNLLAIMTMSEKFQVAVGWSDHTTGSTTAIAAVAMGASLLEKHLTLDRNLPGPDHSASSDPKQFRSYIEVVREAEGALGDGVKQPAAIEEENRALVRRSIHARCDLAAGQALRPEHVVLLRPATGLPPSTPLTDLVVVRSIAAGDVITAEDVDRRRI